MHNILKTKVQNKLRSQANDSGYSLLEILIVLAIMGTLAAVVAPRLMGQVNKSQTVAAKAQVESLRLAADSYALDTGRYPSAQEGLQALYHKPANSTGNWAGPYMEGTLPTDPWGNAYVYQPPNISDNGSVSVPFVISYGADGAPGGAGLNADITS